MESLSFSASHNRNGQPNEWILWSLYWKQNIFNKCPTLKHKLSSQKVTGLCNLVDHPIIVQGHEDVFFCGHEHKGFQVLLGDSALGESLFFTNFSVENLLSQAT